jgi:hypothetical protein
LSSICSLYIYIYIFGHDYNAHDEFEKWVDYSLKKNKMICRLRTRLVLVEWKSPSSRATFVWLGL